MNQPAPGGYLERSEYKTRVSKIQPAIYQSLSENDARFNGDDNIHGIFVFGSYLKSWFMTDNQTLVRRASPGNPGSDLDFLTIESGDRKILKELDKTDIDLLKSSGAAADPEWIKRSQLRLTYLLRRNLHAADLNIPVDPPHLLISLDRPVEHEAEFLAGRHRTSFRLEAGMLFVPESETRRDLIFEIFRQSGLKVVIDPATTAEVLNPSTSP